MKVLLANKFFYDHGGPETVLFATRDLLRRAGHEVVDFAMAGPRNRPSPYASYFAPNVDLQAVRLAPGSLRTAVRFVDSGVAARNMRRLVRDTRPDIAHLHSINHQLTPSIIRVLREEGVPVVMTLHDYKLVCPAYTLLADGRICESCAGGRFYRAFTTSCRGRVRSALLAAESYVQHRLRRSYEGVSLFLSPSRFLARKFEEMGFRRRIEVLPNPSLAGEDATQRAARGSHVLFVGRVVPEKGLRTLCAAAQRSDARVTVVGDGPQLAELRRDFGHLANIEFAGRIEPERARTMMCEALAVVAPSEWYENQPMVILEAFAGGTPVIASDLGGNPELVRDGETGLLHLPGDVGDLAGKLAWAREHPGEMAAMGERARAFAAQFAPEVYLERLLGIYKHVLAEVPEPSAAARVRMVKGHE
jgi:glycosyltransferase involved in cell wall biosynthesis